MFKIEDFYIKNSKSYKRVMEIKYKTIKENNVKINACSRGEKCSCDGSCKKVNKSIYDLERFTPLSNGLMLEDIEGEYVLFSSVLNLFSPKK